MGGFKEDDPKAPAETPSTDAPVEAPVETPAVEVAETPTTEAAFEQEIAAEGGITTLGEI